MQQYRADIDGLRAVAIVPVLLFHAGVAGFGGGFVGVDVFFVISGYLITGIIAREIDAGSFSIVAFYERRARRIMPALLVMIAAVLVAGCLFYLPDDLGELPKAATAATLFVSNIWYFATTNYFGGGAETKPLLHTWSLAVEEQYYIGFPILLILIARFAARWRVAIVAAITVVSFAIAVATQAWGNGFAFYLLPPRAWELFAGSLLALGAVAVPRSALAREMLAGAGLALIAVAVFAYDKTTVFPGVAALPPVLGAAAMILAGPDTRAARALASAPLAGIGLISYSLYLWHWPVIVFAEYIGDARLTGWASVAAIALSLGLAVLSWRFVERPFRNRNNIGRRSILVGTAAAMTLLCFTSLSLWRADGWRARFPAPVLALADARHDVSPDRARCHDAAEGCTIGAGGPGAILWGDSHGVELAYALAEQRPGLVQRTRSSCPPVLDARDVTPVCAAANRATFAAIEASPQLRTIYLAGFWAEHNDAPPAFWQALETTIGRLRASGREVVLIGAMPPARFDVPRRLAHAVQFGAALPMGITGAEARAATEGIAGVALHWQGRITFIDPTALFCEARSCRLHQAGRPLYFDSHHMSLTAARIVAHAAQRAKL